MQNRGKGGVVKIITTKTSAVLCGMLVSCAAHAEIYMCKDASGRTLTSDRPIPECSDRALKVFGNNGIVRREIPAPLTAEQKRQKELDEEKRKAEVAAAEEQKRQDRALLARFKSEADIEAVRKRDQEMFHDQIKREQVSIAAAEKRLQEGRAEAAKHKDAKALPARLQQKIDESQQSIDDSKKLIAAHEAEIAQIGAKFDQTLKRFRELKGSTQAAVAPQAK